MQRGQNIPLTINNRTPWHQSLALQNQALSIKDLPVFGDKKRITFLYMHTICTYSKAKHHLKSYKSRMISLKSRL